MASSSDSVGAPYPQSGTDVHPTPTAFGVSSNAAASDLESPQQHVSATDASLAKGAERFLRIDVDASAPAASGSALPAPMEVIREAINVTAASQAARVDLSPSSSADGDADMTPAAAAAPSTTSPPTIRTKAPPPGFRSPAKSSPTPTRPAADGWGDTDTVYPARSLRMDVEAAGETDAQRLESWSRVDSIIDDIVNIRLDTPERPPVIRGLPPVHAHFLAAVDGWIDVVYERTDIIMRRSLEQPPNRPVPVRYQREAEA